MAIARSVRPTTRERKDEILAAALACFADRGYEATTLSDIRARSKASTGSIYHLFKSKEEIAGAVYLEGMRAYQTAFTAKILGSKSAKSAVRNAVHFYLAWVEEHVELARFLHSTRQAELLPEVKAELHEANRVFYRALRQQFEPQVRVGVLRAMPWELFLVIVMGPVHEHARQWLAGRTRTPLREAAPVLASAAWRAVRGTRNAVKR
jgi:AcrR family transcriptional regulator